MTVTNIEKISRAIDEKSCTCLLLKVNQIGSVSESIAAVKMAKQAGWGVMTSHRSGTLLFLTTTYLIATLGYAF